MTRYDFSVVVPVYNSADSLEELHGRLTATLTDMHASFETIYVNDGSTDDSLSVLDGLRSEATNVRVIDLYRNSGQQNALMCGFSYATGAVIITIDDDLQHAPEDIPSMFERLNEGFDAVFGSFETKHHGLQANLGSAVIRSINHQLFHPPSDLKMSPYRLIRKDIVDIIVRSRTPFPYVTGMILSTTNRVTNVAVRHEPRPHGKSGYGLRSRFRLSKNLLINYSAIPLRIMGYVGLLASLLGLIVGSVFIARQLFVGRAPEGWTSLIVLVSFFGAVMFAMMFVIGEYLTRILSELRDAPPFAVRQELL